MSSASESKTNSTKRMSREELRAANSDPKNGISICIPFVFANIGWRRIKEVFIALRWGFIERVDVIPCPGGNKRAYVHFAPGKWNMRSRHAREALSALQNGDEVKVLYDEPWFWKISISGSVKPDEAPKPRVAAKVTFGRKKVIDLDDSKVTPRSDERKQARKLRISRKVKSAKGPNRNDPIVARSLENSPRNLQNESVESMTESKVSAGELENLPTALRHFDEEEDEIEERGKVVGGM